MTSCEVDEYIIGDPMIHFFFFNDTATTEIYTLSLHDALPILTKLVEAGVKAGVGMAPILPGLSDSPEQDRDRKSTRLNSSHSQISYAVFCLKKKKNKNQHTSHNHVTSSTTHSTMLSCAVFSLS